MNKSEIARLLNREYEKKRFRAEEEYRTRIEKIEKDYPEIAILRAEILDLHFDIARLRMQNDDADALYREIEGKSTRIADILRKHGLKSDALDMHYACPNCRDTGYMGENLLYPCACRKARFYELSYPSLHIDGKQSFETFDVNVFNDEGERSQRRQMQMAREKAENYANAFPANQKPNILIIGESGLGKTFLANCICKRVADRKKSVISITSYALNELFRLRHRGEESLEDIFHCDLLAIDDLGAEPMFENVTIVYLFSLYNQRLLNGKHTITVSNYSLAELSKRYTERVVSRLTDKERTNIWPLSGKDIRRRKM